MIRSSVEAALGQHANQFVVVGDRVEVVGLAQPLLAQIDAGRARSHRCAKRLTQRTPTAERAVLAHVRVEEERAARCEHAAGVAEHVAQRLRGQMLEHIERPRLLERAVLERQPPQIAERQIAARRAPRGERTD